MSAKSDLAPITRTTTGFGKYYNYRFSSQDRFCRFLQPSCKSSIISSIIITCIQHRPHIPSSYTSMISLIPDSPAPLLMFILSHQKNLTVLTGWQEQVILCLQKRGQRAKKYTYLLVFVKMTVTTVTRTHITFPITLHSSNSTSKQTALSSPSHHSNRDLKTTSQSHPPSPPRSLFLSPQDLWHPLGIRRPPRLRPLLPLPHLLLPPVSCRH